MWLTISWWCWWFGKLLISIELFKFLMTRWQSFSSNVRQNIERYNQIELQRSKSSASTICRRCTNLENDSSLSIDSQTTGGTDLEVSIDEPPPAITTSIEIKDNDGQGKISLHRVVSYTGSDENAADQEDFRILEICRTKNLVSKLTKKFEGTAAIRGSSSSSTFKKINEEFIRKSSISKVDTNRFEVPTSRRPSDEASKKDYFVIEKTEVYEVKDNVKPNISPLIITKRSHSIGEITRHRKISPTAVSPTPPPLPDTPVPTSPGVILGGTMENILEADDTAAINGVQLRRPQRHRSSSGSRISVKTVEEILQQERFSKCFSEYSISDLLNDLPDDEDGDDIELTKFFNRIK